MASKGTREQMSERYQQEAEDYLRSLPPEHFMEATPQATQREITLESLALVRAQRRDFHVFNELLVQYPRPGMRRLGKVVPDNMVVLHDGPLKALLSYTVHEQPAGPFWVLEYVSKSSKRKDYDDNMDKYERDLRVPYYLLFQPDVLELTLYRHNGKKYVSVKPNAQERYPLKELELEVALLDDWVRFWFRGNLLPLPADFQRELTAAHEARLAAEKALEQERRARLAAEQARHAAEQGHNQERQARLAAEQGHEQERQARLAAEQELARLRAEMEQTKRRRNHK